MEKEIKKSFMEFIKDFPETKNVKKEANGEEGSPFLQWVGGKRGLIENYKSYFPKSFNQYFEPFLGGGAMFFKLKPDKAYLGDNNLELIRTFKAVKEKPDEVVFLLSELRKRHSKELYLFIRNLDRNENIIKEFEDFEIAARMIYLNQTGFNGIYRVNKKGQFNVPIGSSLNRTICDSNRIKQASNILKNTTIACSDFSEAIKIASEGDFVYLDPPYSPISKYSDFTRYTKEKFYEKDQKRLKESIDELTKKKCFVMLSNSDCDFIRKLYSGYKIIEFSKKRLLSSKSSQRNQEIGELLILNYEGDTLLEPKEQ
ncbi:MAG: Dam family site-specific DNA-(adenine-N6)-methyltransferase [Candidatus Pacearchaeota archaeon]